MGELAAAGITALLDLASLSARQARIIAMRCRIGMVAETAEVP
jgi:hypothetical protein